MRRIASRQNPVVARYRAAARGDARDVMLLDGRHLVEEAVDANVAIREAAISATEADAGSCGDLVSKLEQMGVDVVVATAPVMAALSPVRSSSPIVALAARPTRADVYCRDVNGTAVDGTAADGTTLPCVAIVADMQDPGNVGAILRVAEAAGATGVIVAGQSADPFGWKALRGSMGSALRLPIGTHTRAVMDAIADARRHHCRIVATVPRGGRSIFDVDLRGPVAVVIGGEGMGLPSAIIEQADERVSIPMQAPVESLNAAVTAALVLYEVRRQRAD